MTDVEPGRHRRSRFAWPTSTEPTTTPAGTHSHKQSNGPLLIAYLAIVLLFVVNAALVFYVWQQQQYIAGKGEQRDREGQRLEQQIHDAVCDLLDQLPQGGLLERPRQKYGCGPGIPFENLTPDEQARLRPSATPAQPTVAERPDPLEVPDRTRERRPIVTGPPPTAPDRFRPEPSPDPDPLGPVTERVCGALGICIPEEN